MTEEQCVGLMHKGFNKTDVNVVLKLFRRICGRTKVQQNLMKSVDNSINDLKKWFKSEAIVLRRNPDKKLKEKVGVVTKSDDDHRISAATFDHVFVH